MTIRIGRLGYQIKVDTTARVWAETPSSWGHLREQRIRWSRGSIHVLARNLSSIWMLQGPRGIWVIPIACVGVLHRSVTMPIWIYAGLVALIDPSALNLRQGAAVLAVLLGPSVMINLGLLLWHRRFDLIPSIPLYVAFRVIRSYLSLEALFTLPLKSREQTNKSPVPSQLPVYGRPLSQITLGRAGPI